MRSIAKTGILTVVLLSSLITTGCAPIIFAGVGTGALVAEDRRTSGAFIDDEIIENKIQHRANERYGYDIHINAVSFNYNVLLAGQVPNEEAKREVERMAYGVEHVRHVYNELEIAPLLSLSARSTDTYITSKIKTRFLDAQKFNVTRVKVYTEDSVVYLMGIVTREEGEAATDIARSTDGVKKVVRLFEYGTRDSADTVSRTHREGDSTFSDDHRYESDSR